MKHPHYRNRTGEYRILESDLTQVGFKHLGPADYVPVIREMLTILEDRYLLNLSMLDPEAIERRKALQAARRR